MKVDGKLGFKRYWLKPTLVVLATGLLAACGSQDEPDPREIEVENLSFISSEDVALSSTLYQDLGDEVSYFLATPPSNGSVVVSPSGEFEYIPNADFNGDDSFVYTASDNDVTSNLGVVDIEVTPVNDVPTTAAINLSSIGLSVVEGQFLAQDIDGDDLLFSVVSQGQYGELNLSTSGEFSYTPSTAVTAIEVIEVAVSDGSVEVLTNLTIDLVATSLSVTSELTYAVEQYSLVEASFSISNSLDQSIPVQLVSMPSWFDGDVSTIVPANATINVNFSIDAQHLELGMQIGEVGLVDGASGASIAHNLSIDVTPDVTSPEVVDDLQATQGDFYQQVNLSWTAVMDNHRSTIPADAYDLRYSLEPLTESNWQFATPIDTSEPLSPGGVESAQIDNLEGNTTYYFALKSSDREINVSALSNVAIITTPIRRSVELSPGSAQVSLSSDERREVLLTLRNDTEEVLDYSAVVNEIVSPESRQKLIIRKQHSPEKKIKMPSFTGADVAQSSGGIIVKRKSGQGAFVRVVDAFSKKNLTLKGTFNKLNIDVLGAKGKSDEEIADSINYLNSLPDVLFAEPDYLVHTTSTPNDALYSQQWAVNNEGQTGGTIDADIDASEVWDLSSDGSNVVVAVIDTGVNYNHEDLTNNMWTNPGEIPGNGIDDDENGFIDDVYGYDFVNNDGDPIDDHDHGTHCAGIMAAEGNNGVGIAGAVHSAQIMAVKFLSATGSGSTSGAIESILYAVDNGATILSNSWGGGGFSQALEDAITYANDHDVLFIAAAGNSALNNDFSPHYPSSYNVENVIAVASTTHSDGMSYFSNYGLTTVDLGAPGSDILSSVSNGGYASFSGTSMATPYVAGAAVLIRSNFPDLSALQVKQILMDSVDPITALDGRVVTGGRLNIDSAFSLAQTQSGMVSIVQNAQGVIPANQQVQIPVSINTFNKGVGSYPFQIDFDLGDSQIPELTFDLSIDVIEDVVPPAAIGDLFAQNVTSDSISFGWTNTGDDGLDGNAEEVQIAYSTEPINNDNWNDVPKLTGITPNDSGEPQQATIGGLSRNTMYYFAAKVIDNSQNSSILSNVESASTLIGPALDLFPLEFDPVVLTQGQGADLELELSNIGDEVLTYQVRASAVEGAEPAALKANPDALNYSVNVEKGEEELPLGQPVVQGSGGPDAFGYRWSDSDEGGTTYDWQDIAVLGSPITFSDDSVRGPISLGFDFEFYGETYNQVWVSSNGFISFEAPSGSGCCSGQPVPSADTYNNIIAWAWADLYPISGYTAHSFAEAGKFTIQFKNYGEYGDSGVASSQIILSSVGSIKLQYQNVDSDFGLNDASIGIENADGTDGLQVAFNTDYLHDELAVEFFSGPEWIGLSQSSGELEAGMSDDIGITIDSAGQALGSYDAELHIISNDSGQPEVVIPLRMEVVAP